jgi:transposase InsO family protein
MKKGVVSHAANGKGRYVAPVTGRFVRSPRKCCRHLDFQFDQTDDDRPLKLLNVIDEFTRECPAIKIGRSLGADDVVETLDRIAMVRGYPQYLRLDNGPEFVAAAVADWCRFNSTHTIFIEPGSPWQNAWIESFNSRVRDELLNITRARARRWYRRRRTVRWRSHQHVDPVTRIRPGGHVQQRLELRLHWC